MAERCSCNEPGCPGYPGFHDAERGDNTRPGSCPRDATEKILGKPYCKPCADAIRAIIGGQQRAIERGLGWK